jgi:hypothetical protein
MAQGTRRTRAVTKLCSACDTEDFSSSKLGLIVKDKINIGYNKGTLLYFSGDNL